MYFPALDNAIHLLSTLPGIGRRSAMRVAFHLIRKDHHTSRQIADAILELKEQVRFCKICGGLTDRDVCEICEDVRRDESLICVVEDPGDIYAIEKTSEYRGKYHVLMGALSPLDGIGPDDLRIAELLDRIKHSEISELIMATNPTMEGDATAQYIASKLKDTGIRISRISHGISTGSSIEYADQSALARSIKNRQDL